MQIVESVGGCLSAFGSAVRSVAELTGYYLGKAVTAVCDDLHAFMQDVKRDFIDPPKKSVKKRKVAGSKKQQKPLAFYLATALASKVQPSPEMKQLAKNTMPLAYGIQRAIEK